MIAFGLILAALVWTPAQDTGAGAGRADCVRPSGVQRIVFSARKYPNVRRRFRGAVRRGWPRPPGGQSSRGGCRRERALRDIPTREGFYRDECPPAVGRGRGRGLERGRNPRGWKADVG
jgi:hypothetical protein